MYKYFIYILFFVINTQAGLDLLEVDCSGIKKSFKIGDADDVIEEFRSVAMGRKVLTLIGYSGRGYQEKDLLHTAVETLLKKYDPKEYVFNAGVTPDGIGEMYELAKKMGFETFGVVSSEAVPYLNYVKDVDFPFIVRDDTWGGYTGEDKTTLSPVSRAMVEVSDIMVAYGAGEIGLSELQEGLKKGKTVQAHMMEENHEKCIAAAAKKKQPKPTQFYFAPFKGFVDKLSPS